MITTMRIRNVVSRKFLQLTCIHLFRCVLNLRYIHLYLHMQVTEVRPVDDSTIVTLNSLVRGRTAP
eukprot:m.1443819 g.1443819  ORF g.1443819 m.1443819 type:complete len:66 (-) comp25103_c0_seq19:829-1026(-)